jgi:hypothetical protein
LKEIRNMHKAASNYPGSPGDCKARIIETTVVAAVWRPDTPPTERATVICGERSAFIEGKQMPPSDIGAAVCGLCINCPNKTADINKPFPSKQ